MTNEQVERAIEFLLEHHSKVSADIERHSEQIERQSKQIEKLTDAVFSLSNSVKVMQQEMEANRLETRQEIEANRLEMREAINNMIVANEVTRKLAEDVARLAVATSQRVSRLEDASPS